METLLRVGLGNAVAAGLLALGAASVGIFARGRPALRHGLWILVLLKLVTPPLWTVPITWVADPSPYEAAPRAKAKESVARSPDGGETAAFEAPAAPDLLLPEDPEAGDIVPAGLLAVLKRAIVPDQRSWSEWVFLLWGTGSLLTFGVAVWRIRQFQRILSLAEPAPEMLRGQVETLSRRLGMARIPTIGLVSGAVSPLVWALGCRPCLILPRGLWDRLDERQRDTLLAHELAHLRRRDHWVRGLELLVTGLYWWLPVVWIARHALREAEEQCCDAWVVWAFPDATRTYAEALLETLDFLAGAGPAAAVAASGLGPVHHLKRRMTMIMQGTTPRTLTWSGLLAMLGLSATLLPLSPTWAQQRPALEQQANEASVSAADEPVARDPVSKRKADRERGDEPKPRREVRREGAIDKEVTAGSEALEKVLAELKEMATRSAGGFLDERARGELERAIQQVQALVQRLPTETESREGKRRTKPGAADDGAGAKEQRAEVAKLRAEVAERQKAFVDAQMRLAKAMRQLAGVGPVPAPLARTELFEFRFAKPGDSAFEHQKMLKIIPRPDQEKRIAELEARLEKLQDEVKSLKKDAPDNK